MLMHMQRIRKSSMNQEYRKTSIQEITSTLIKIFDRNGRARMPIYESECTKCKGEKIVQNISIELFSVSAKLIYGENRKY